ncbi:unnamed protein product [Ceratitis capitata]|uniref:(Mediterranean fruit fly) hypothetical protein n=1 Tax=Ceratitis capitata TaxID=7213 RepID=A0A811V074_CERCA|nr:unnamed protein product [Ceratitis capitata]
MIGSGSGSGKSRQIDDKTTHRILCGVEQEVSLWQRGGWCAGLHLDVATTIINATTTCISNSYMDCMQHHLINCHNYNKLVHGTHQVGTTTTVQITTSVQQQHQQQQS